jgi:hypothetical protein
MPRRSSRFARLAGEIAAEYRRKGYSPERARAIGRATAAVIGRRKYGVKGMTRRAQAGRRRARRRR